MQEVLVPQFSFSYNRVNNKQGVNIEEVIRLTRATTMGILLLLFFLEEGLFLQEEGKVREGPELFSL